MNSCKFILLLIMLLGFQILNAQSVGSSVPKQINQQDQFLFYLHGGVVTVLGDNAINNGAPEWGPYEYSKILDSLSKMGFRVISEIRKQDINDSVYTNKICAQIDTLLKAGVKPSSILLIGASAGTLYLMQVSNKLQNPDLRIVYMGGCWPETYKDYTNYTLRGYFLSLIEASDSHGTCASIFENRKTLSGYKEIKINTGLSHGFFYKARAAWMTPVLNWFQELKTK